MEQLHQFEHIAQALGAELAGFEQLRGGSSANVWRLDLVDGDLAWPVVFRQHEPGELKDRLANDAAAAVARKEYQLLGVLHQLGIPVAAPLLLDDTNRLLVTEFVVGDSFVDPTRVSAALDQMVDLLLRLHSLDAERLSGVELVALEDPVKRLLTCMPASPAGQQLGSLAATNALVVRSNTPVLIHGDYWPGNVLWADGRLAALIDWEDARLGDPLADLACARVELLCQYDAAAMDHFTTRYLGQAMDLDTQSLPVWECYVSATALSSMHQWGLDPTEEARRRSLTESFFDTAANQLIGVPR